MVRAGRRGGKTTIAAGVAVEYFLQGKRVLYAVPTSDQLLRFWIEVNAALKEPLANNVYSVNETMHTIERSKLDQARIRAKTAWNADTLRGDFADVLILDEWQLMAEEAWHKVGAPMLIDNHGDAIFIYTPPSLHSKSMSKAVDKRHASKLYKAAQAHEKQMEEYGLPPEWQTFHWTSLDNPHLSKEGLDQVARDMTELAYRQEILAEDVDEAPGALWKRKTLADYRVQHVPDNLTRIIVAVDPPGGATECGIIVAGVGPCSCKGREEQHGFVLEDNSTAAGQGPEIWSKAVVDAYKRWKANKVIAEKNFGGDMVKHTINTEDKDVIVEVIHATKSKAVRAEPVAAKYEKGMVHHVGEHQDLENEQCEWVPGMRGHSPNRVDADVWALMELVIQPGYQPATSGQAVSSGVIPGEFRTPSSWPTTF